MNYLLLLLVLLLALFIYKNLKHHLVRQSFKSIFIILVFIAILLVLASYVDIAGLFTKDSVLVRTGASVKETIEDNFQEADLIQEEKLKEVSASALENIKNSELARKLYK